MDSPEILCLLRTEVLYDGNFCYALEMKKLQKHTAILAEILYFSGPLTARSYRFESPGPMQKSSLFWKITLKKRKTLGRFFSSQPLNGSKKRALKNVSANGVHISLMGNAGPMHLTCCN